MRRRTIRRSIGVLLVILAIGMIVWPLEWEHNQSEVGRQLIQELNQTVSGGCKITKLNGGVLSGLPGGVVAPVLPGTSEATLNVALGLESGSAWPGNTGVSLLLGHDVGYLSSDQNLRPGDKLTFTRDCIVSTFEVVGSFVLKPGQVIPSPGYSGLALDSCWPTNALWFTPDRLIVTARLIGITHAKSNEPMPIVSQLPTAVGASKILDSWRMGTLSLIGNPSVTFKEGPMALAWEGAALSWLAHNRNGNWDFKPVSSLNVTEYVNDNNLIYVALNSTTTAGPVQVILRPVGLSLVS